MTEIHGALRVAARLDRTVMLEADKFNNSEDVDQLDGTVRQGNQLGLT